MEALRRAIRKNPRLREAIRPLVRRLQPVLRRIVPPPPQMDYGEWRCEYDTPRGDARRRIRDEIADWREPPLISVVLVADAESDAGLQRALESVRAQLYPVWEVCLSRVVPAGAAAAPRPMEDERFRLAPSASTAADARNAAVAMARGQWIVPLREQDCLAEDALFNLVREAMRHPETALIYSDEDRIDAAGLRRDPYFKTDFDPDLLLVQDYLSNFVAYRRDLMDRLGGFRSTVASSDHELALRAAHAVGAGAIRHIPYVLCHAGSERGWAATERAVVEGALAATGAQGRVAPNPLAPEGLRVIRPVPQPEPLVSVIVPTRDRAELLRPCIEGLLHRTDYKAIEVLIADNGSTEPDALALLEELRADPRVRVLEQPGPFNYSRLNNRAVAEARGEILLLLNNDIEVISGDWLHELVSHAVRPEIGAVGPKLLYPDGTVQHAGVLLGIGWPAGVAGHVYAGLAGTDPGPFGLLAATRSVAAVTGACLAVRRCLYDEVGGLDEERLTVAFNDVDFCLRLHARGYRNLWTPFSVLFHKESASRGEDLTGAKARRFAGEIATMRERWADLLDNDPYWNPNLALTSLDRRLADPPRLRRW